MVFGQFSCFLKIYIYIIILLASNTLTNSIVFISLLKKAQKRFQDHSPGYGEDVSPALSMLFKCSLF